MRAAFKTRVYSGFALAILLCVISGTTSYILLQKQQNQRVWVRKARSVLDTTTAIQGTLIEMGNSRTQFRATNQKEFLEPYYNGLKTIAPRTAKLKELVSDDPEVESIDALLEQHIADLFAFWKHNGDDAETYTKEKITQLTEDEKGKMDEIRVLTNELQKNETKLFNKRREEYDQLVHYATLSTSIDSIISLIIIVVLIYVIIREFQSRYRVQEQLHVSVEQLKSQTEVLQRSETDLKKTMDELAGINTQLEKFVYTVAHDIKSPLSGIVGALGIIKSEEVVQKNERLVQFVDLSADAAVHLTDMVNLLLEYSRSNLVKQAPEPVNMKELLEQLAVLLFPPKNVHIYVPEVMPLFTTRKLKIIQVFQNLISNAIKYNDKEKGIIDIGYTDEGDHYTFFVKDNGQGIPAGMQDKIFTLTRTAGSRSVLDSSTGFGLNIAKMIVEEQGGKIWFESVVGEGTTFYFEWKK